MAPDAPKITIFMTEGYPSRRQLGNGSADEARECSGKCPFLALNGRADRRMVTSAYRGDADATKTHSRSATEGNSHLARRPRHQPGWSAGYARLPRGYSVLPPLHFELVRPIAVGFTSSAAVLL